MVKTKIRLEQLIPNDYKTEYLDYINDAAISRYGMEGGLRFYEGVKETFLGMQDHTLVRHPNRPKKTSLLSKLLTIEPIHFFLTVFDRTVAKSKHRLLSASAGAFALTTYLQSIMFSLGALSAQAATGLPIQEIFSSIPSSVLISMFLVGPISSAVFIGAAQSTLVGFNKIRNSGKGITLEEIESDIQRYSSDFRKVWDSYVDNFSKNKTEDPSVAEINGMYMLVTTRESIFANKNKRNLKVHDRSILDTIKRVYKKEISSNVIFHPDIRNIGGVTLLPSVLLGLSTRKSDYIFGPVILNKLRLYANPNYDDALAHELAHAAGFMSESRANYFALKVMDELNHEHPLEGYDIYSSVNRLCFAVSALSDKLKDEERFQERLTALSVPKFVFQAIRSPFSPEISPLPGLEEALSGEFGKMNAEFSKQYSTNTYYVTKKVEKGMLRLDMHSY